MITDTKITVKRTGNEIYEGKIAIALLRPEDLVTFQFTLMGSKLERELIFEGIKSSPESSSDYAYFIKRTHKDIISAHPFCIQRSLEGDYINFDDINSWGYVELNCRVENDKDPNFSRRDELLRRHGI